MKPILIDISKFGGEKVLPDLQKLVDDAYKQGYNDGFRNFGWRDDSRNIQPPLVSFRENGMSVEDFDWIGDET